MRPADQLARFVEEALKAGRSRAEVAEVLGQAGWTASEIKGALNAWAETGFTPPVPRPRPYVSAREAFFYALMFAALALSAFHVIKLGFELIELWLPDLTDRTGYYSTRSARWSIAYLAVSFPVFLVLNMRAEKALRADAGARRSAVRKWFGYVTLFLAALTFLGDLVAVIYALLNGDLTARFAAKAALVAAVAVLVAVYFRGELDEAGDAD